MPPIKPGCLRVQLFVSVTDHEGRCVTEHAAITGHFDAVRSTRVAAEAIAAMKEVLNPKSRPTRAE